MDTFVRRVLWAVAIAAAIGLSWIGYTVATAALVTKTIVAKDTEAIAYLHGGTGSSSVRYFVVAEDGSYVYVHKGVWHTLKPGGTYTSKWWIR